MMEGVRMGPCKQATVPSLKAVPLAYKGAIALSVNIEKKEKKKYPKLKHEKYPKLKHEVITVFERFLNPWCCAQQHRQADKNDIQLLNCQEGDVTIIAKFCKAQAGVVISLNEFSHHGARLFGKTGNGKPTIFIIDLIIAPLDEMRERQGTEQARGRVATKPRFLESLHASLTRCVTPTALEEPQSCDKKRAQRCDVSSLRFLLTGLERLGQNPLVLWLVLIDSDADRMGQQRGNQVNKDCGSVWQELKQTNLQLTSIKSYINIVVHLSSMHRRSHSRSRLYSVLCQLGVLIVLKQQEPGQLLWGWTILEIMEPQTSLD
ncbi:unnamed protein product [Menidia menidia]|uniref:(Atlantic silverside) hypothetical protein n=1 Tax=Menidia menidia TaxID=238744 RepID=A0A8S4BQL2_9TELE|nr:unnamed protein product [Menidia menidia]